MDERDADIFVDQAARCRRLAWNIADDAAKLKLTGHDDGGLAEEQQENWGAVERGERGSRSGPLATTVVCFRGCMQEMAAVARACGGPTPVTQGSVYRREYRALQSSGLDVQRYRPVVRTRLVASPVPPAISRSS
jgi:hypothetical protein